MSATSEDLLMKGQLQGRIAGITRKDVSQCLKHTALLKFNVRVRVS